MDAFNNCRGSVVNMSVTSVQLLTVTLMNGQSLSRFTESVQLIVAVTVSGMHQPEQLKYVLTSTESNNKLQQEQQQQE